MLRSQCRRGNADVPTIIRQDGQLRSTFGTRTEEIRARVSDSEATKRLSEPSCKHAGPNSDLDAGSERGGHDRRGDPAGGADYDAWHALRGARKHHRRDGLADRSADRQGLQM